MGVGLPPAIARGRNAHETRVEPVLHETNEYTVLDQRGAVGRCALVINGDRPATVRDRAIIHNGDALGRNTASHEACKSRCALAVEVAFKPMANRFMQQNAGPAGAKQNIGLARWRRLGIKRHQALPVSLARRILPEIICYI